MATAPVKSQPLHYFSLPHLKWGQKSHTNTNHRFRRRESPPSTADNHLTPPQTADDADGDFDADVINGSQKQLPEEEEQEGEVKLWNLRPRKGVMKLELQGETASLKSVEMGVVESSSNNHMVLQRSQRLKDNENGHGVVGSGREKKRKLWISLSKEEIEEDVYSMTGSRPARRPKKRSKTIQKQLDAVFPGLYLVGLTADSFRVPDTTK